MRSTALWVTLTLSLAAFSCGTKERKEPAPASDKLSKPTSSNQFPDNHHAQQQPQGTFQQPLLVPPRPSQNNTDQQPNNATGNNLQRPSLIVVIGGNSSCDHQFDGWGRKTLFDGFNRMTTKLRKKYKVYIDNNVLFACYWKDSTEMVFNSTDERPDQSHPIQHQDLASVVMQKAQPQTSVTIIGYSYGGWRAMVLTDELAKRGFRNQVLFTIDPISRNCSNIRQRECREAPRDLDHQMRQQVAASTISWVNFYQKMPILHSSEIPEADFNYKIRLRAHWFLDTSYKVWNLITDHFVGLSTAYDPQNYDLGYRDNTDYRHGQ